MSRRVPVLVVGGGPVGLALAGELGFQGVACELVEQGDGIVRTPKLVEVNIRTMELCRRWGIDGAVHACPFPGDYPLDVVFLRNFAEEELARISRPARDVGEPGPHSPMRFQSCPQIWFDPILQRFARAQPGVKLRYRVRLESCREQDDEVEATLRDLATGAEERVLADYLAACDGTGSTIRTAANIALDGSVLGHTVHMHFRAPRLIEGFGKAPAGFFHLLDHDGLWATMRVIDPVAAMWRIMVLHLDDLASAERVDPRQVLARVLGRAHDVEWVDSYVWTRRSMVAERYRQGRVFLVGDSAHQFSPTGALGMNTGLVDAVDLGWKLAAVLRGWGGGGLLESYETERRPVAIVNATRTAEFYREYTKFGGALAEIDAAPSAERGLRRQRLAERLLREVGRNFRTLGLQLGYRYDGSPICVDDGARRPPVAPDLYEPSTHPGARAPHAWLGERRSTLDLFSKSYALLRVGEGAPAAGAFEVAARGRGIPWRTFDLADPRARAVYDRALVVVRPDGHVAWRGDEMPEEVDAVVEHIRGGAPLATAGIPRALQDR